MVDVDEQLGGRICDACGSPAAPTAKFCAECGAPLEPAPETPELRKLVSLLFCDLVGSTALGERLDPEAFRRVQLRYYATCEEALHRHRGTIEKFIGDAVMCVFGIPVAYEDDAHRACRAALDLIAGIEALNVELEEAWGVRLVVRIGVNTGVGIVGDPSGGRALVTGDPVNTAARLEQAAAPGEVLIGATTRELIGDEGVCVPVPPLELKGKGGRVPAWRLLDMSTTRSEEVARASAIALIGRDDELHRIESWLGSEEVGRSGGLCLILGPPGIGKSRLLAEIAARTTRAAYWGRCPPYGESISYRLLAEWLDGLGEDGIERAAGARGAERLRFATEQSDAPATTAEIEQSALVVMTDLGRATQVMLLAEDVHWAEPAMLDLLVSLSRVPGIPILATARPEVLDARPDLAEAGHDVRIPLEPLDSASAELMLEELASDVVGADGGRLVRDAEGNPLMLLQLARHVAEGGDPEKLPAGLEAVLQARVEGLSVEERAVAERGAVMGREFWDSGVEALAPDTTSPAPALALLAQRDFVVEGRADGAPQLVSPTLSHVFSSVARPYSFTHALLRDSVYEATPKLRRADLHERLGGILEQSGASDELVAFHLERAARLRSELRPQESEELAGRAAGHLERAGERALARRDGNAARALLTRAAALLDDGTAARERIESSLAVAGPTSGEVELVPGDVIGGYRVRAIAGRGGMGVVYRAEDLALGREVALKVIAPQLAGDSRFRQRFARESRIAAGLEHPNVVPVYGAGEENGRLFIAMRYVDGTDLQQLLRQGPLDPHRAVALVGQVAGALDAAHTRGLVHRDVKPANVLVTSIGGTEQVYLTDFGLTRETAAGDGLTKTGQWVGTLAYVAPEQIRGEPIDARVDVYALGAVLYQAVTGSPPFGVESELEALAAHLDEPPPKPSKSGAPKALDDVVERAMSKDPSRRFRSAGDLGRAAAAAVEGGRVRLAERSVATGAAAPVDVGRRRHRRSRGGVLLAGAGAGAVVVAALAIAALAGVFAGGGGAPDNPAGRIVGDPVSLPYDPDYLAADDTYAWALAGQSNRLMRVDIGTEEIQAFSAAVDLGGGSFPDVELGPNAVWIAHAVADVGGVDHVDPETGQAVQHVPFPFATALAVGVGEVWAVAPGKAKTPGSLVRIATPADRITSRVVTGHDPRDVALAEGSVWVANRADGTVWRIDPRTRAVTAKIRVGSQPAVLAVGGGRVWVANLGDNTLMRIDSSTGRVEGAAISLGKDIHDLAASDDAVWVSAADGTVTRLDPATGEIVGSPLSPARAPLSLAVNGDVVWVGSVADRTLTRIADGV